jgi:hypothetical protein
VAEFPFFGGATHTQVIDGLNTLDVNNSGLASRVTDAETFISDAGGDGEAVANKLAETVSVRDFGTDAAAIQAAIDAAGAGGVVELGPYTYAGYAVAPKISQPSVTFKGHPGKTILKPEAAIPALEIVGTSGTRASNCVIDGITIDGLVSGGSGATLGDYIATSGIRLAWCELTTFRDVVVKYCNGPGFYADNTGSVNGLRFFSCMARWNNGAGLDARGKPNCNNIELHGCDFFNNYTYGVDTDSTSFRAFGGWITGNWLYAARLGTSTGAFFDKTTIEGSWRGTPGAGTSPALSAWGATTAYEVGHRRWPTNTTANPYTFQCTVAGTSGGSEPTWPTAPGATVVDGTVTWTNVGRNAEGGAGIDDTGSNKCIYWRENNNNQPMLGLGNSVDITVNSDGPGGALEMLFGRTTLGPQNGVLFRGATGTSVVEARGVPANLDVNVRPKGTGGVTLGNGSGGSAPTKITNHRQVLATLDFPSIAAQSAEELTITATGAATGDNCYANPHTTLEAGLVWSAWVSATDTIRIRVANITSGAIDPASRQWRADFWKHV